MDDSSDRISTRLVEKAQLMLRRPSLDSDICSILDQCLKKAEQQIILLQSGICNINFPEIAIVLELCALIFGKKIALMWEYLLNCQKNLAKFHIEKKKIQEEQDAVEKRVEKFRRKRKKQQEKVVTRSKTFDVSKLPDLNIRYNTEEELSVKSKVSFHYLCDFPIGPEEDPIDYHMRPLFVTTDHPIVFRDEYLCSNNQVLTQNIQFQAGDYIRQTQHNVFHNFDVAAIGDDLRDEILQKYLIEKKITLWDMTDEHEKEFSVYIEKELQERSPLRKKSKQLCPRRSSIFLTRLSDDVLNQYLKKDRMSIDEKSVAGMSASNDSGIADCDDAAQAENDEINDSCEKNVSSNIENDQSINVTDKDEQEKGECEKTTEENGRSEEDTTDNSEKNTEDIATRKEMDTENNESTISEGNDNENTNEIIENINKRERRKSKRPLDDEFVDLDEEVPKRKILKESDELKCRKVITRLLNEFEMFFFRNYRPEDGEGILTEPVCLEESTCETNNQSLTLSQDSGILEDFDIDADEVGSDADDHMDSNVDLPDTNTELPPIDTNLPASTNEMNNNISKEHLIKPSTSAGYDKLQELLNKQQAALEKYIQWKDSVDETLKIAEKKDFDIHEYETKILDALPDDRQVPFKNVMQGKNPSQVARFFAASLQLTNTSNIQLLNITPGKLANEGLEMRVISRERHHEQLEAYEAPSVENRKEVMKRIRAVHNKPSTSKVIPYKKMRF